MDYQSVGSRSDERLTLETSAIHQTLRRKTYHVNKRVNARNVSFSALNITAKNQSVSSNEGLNARNASFSPNVTAKIRATDVNQSALTKG